MLTIVVGEVEAFDSSSKEFTTQGGTSIELEHSLVSLSKWESKHEKPFLSKEEKTSKEVLDYIKFMVVTPKVPEELFLELSEKNIKDINSYIDAKMTATTISELPNQPRQSEIITAEIVYYWMISFNIPFECENWHLNRLFTLIRVCNIKQEKPRTMSRSALASRNREINAQRKAQLGTRG